MAGMLIVCPFSSSLVTSGNEMDFVETYVCSYLKFPTIYFPKPAWLEQILFNQPPCIKIWVVLFMIHKVLFSR